MTREEALKILDTIPTISEQVDALEMAIKALEQKPKWIPVSERLPEDNKAYLVTVELTFARGERYVSQERKVNWDKMKECSHEIIAWMPLPEPYEPQEGASR